MDLLNKYFIYLAFGGHSVHMNWLFPHCTVGHWPGDDDDDDTWISCSGGGITEKFAQLTYSAWRGLAKYRVHYSQRSSSSHSLTWPTTTAQAAAMIDADGSPIRFGGERLFICLIGLSPQHLQIATHRQSIVIKSVADSSSVPDFSPSVRRSTLAGNIYLLIIDWLRSMAMRADDERVSLPLAGYWFYS